MRNITKFLLAGIAAATLASADTLVLNSGQSYQGIYLGGTSRQIRLDVDGQVQTFDLNQVKSISFQQDGGSSSSSSSSGQAPSLRRLEPDSRARNQDSGSQDAPPRMRRAVDGSSASSSNYPADSGSSAYGLTLDSGTRITVRMIDPVDSETARIGQTFRASIDEPVSAGDRVVIPRGADVLTKLVSDQKSGKISGSTVLTMAIMNITINGQPVDVTTSDVKTESSSRGKKSAGMIGGGTALGAIIGGIAGGGKGAAIGAASGAAAGTGVQVLTGGQKVKIPSETRLTFSLQNPVRI